MNEWKEYREAIQLKLADLNKEMQTALIPTECHSQLRRLCWNDTNLLQEQQILENHAYFNNLSSRWIDLTLFHNLKKVFTFIIWKPRVSNFFPLPGIPSHSLMSTQSTSGGYPDWVPVELNKHTTLDSVSSITIWRRDNFQSGDAPWIFSVSPTKPAKSGVCPG